MIDVATEEPKRLSMPENLHGLNLEFSRRGARNMGDKPYPAYAGSYS
jgi:hypothetical protein